MKTVENWVKKEGRPDTDEEIKVGGLINLATMHGFEAEIIDGQLIIRYPESKIYYGGPRGHFWDGITILHDYEYELTNKNK